MFFSFSRAGRGAAAVMRRISPRASTHRRRPLFLTTSDSDVISSSCFYLHRVCMYGPGKLSRHGKFCTQCDSASTQHEEQELALRPRVLLSAASALVWAWCNGAPHLLTEVCSGSARFAPRAGTPNILTPIMQTKGECERHPDAAAAKLPPGASPDLEQFLYSFLVSMCC